MHSGSSKNAARCGILRIGDGWMMRLSWESMVITVRIYSDCSRISALIGVGIGMLNMNRDLIGFITCLMMGLRS